MKSRIKQKLLVFATIILIIHVIIGFSVYNTSKKFNQSAQLVEHTEDVISKSDKILLLGEDIETASRGFVITNDSSFLEPLFAAKKIVFTNISQLSQLVQNNRAQQMRVDSIYYYIQKRLVFSLSQVNLRSNQGISAAIDLSKTNKGKVFSDRIRQISAAIVREESNLLLQRKQANQHSINTFKWISGVFYILMLLITLLLFLSTSKKLIQNKKYEIQAAELVIANQKLSFQNKEKENRAVELIIANKELLFQNGEKEKRAAELIVANKELAFQNDEKEKRAAELIFAVEKAKESDRLKSAFLSNMSHEIRTPMNGLLGFTSMLLEPDLTAETKQEYIGIIEQCGTRMLDTIENIIDISKIESGQKDVSISETNINTQLEDIQSFFKPEANGKGIQIIIKNASPTKETIVNSDPGKLKQILTNLVKNAIKFTHQGFIELGFELKKTITTSDKPTATSYLLEFYIKDTGVGIRPDDMQFIFERFRQGSESLNRKYEGAGLGLAISKAYIEMLNGKIWIESELGKGSTIYFTIPYIPDNGKRA